MHLVLTGGHAEKMSDDKMNKMVVLLLATGAQPNIKDRKHKLPLDYALKQFFHKAAMSLLAIGADIVPFAETNTLLDSHEVCVGIMHGRIGLQATHFHPGVEIGLQATHFHPGVRREANSPRAFQSRVVRITCIRPSD